MGKYLPWRAKREALDSGGETLPPPTAFLCEIPAGTVTLSASQADGRSYLDSVSSGGPTAPLKSGP